jgi:transposase-like protein
VFMRKYNSPRRTWKYSIELKVNAVQLSFVTIKSVAEKLVIHPFMLSRWRKEHRERYLWLTNEKKWKRSLAEEHQADIDSSKTQSQK